MNLYFLFKFVYKRLVGGWMWLLVLLSKVELMWYDLIWAFWKRLRSLCRPGRSGYGAPKLKQRLGPSQCNCSLLVSCNWSSYMAAYSRKMSGQYKLIEMGGRGDYLHYRCCCVLPNKMSYTRKPLLSRLPKGICKNECDLKWRNLSKSNWEIFSHSI